MATVEDVSALQSGVSSLGGYVFGPIERAGSLLAAERSELVAEREAFRAFAERVRKTDARSVSPDERRLISGRERSNDTLIGRVRDHYRDTVLAVDHYDDEYGESLQVNVASELGMDLGVALESRSGVQFSQLLKDRLVAASLTASEERESFLAETERERNDIEHHRDDLADVLDELNAAVSSSGSPDNVQSKLDYIVRRRQETVHGHRYTDSVRPLCEYLYADAPWDYPVLTAASRLYESVTP